MTSNLNTSIALVWISLLGASLSLSLAISNLLIMLALVYLLVTQRPLVQASLKLPYIKVLLCIALIFQSIEFIHDGWVLAKASKVFLLFGISFIIGHCIDKLNINYLHWLLLGLVFGIIIGTTLNHYMNPTYSLWATYSMTYANQASGFVITVGLLSIATKQWRIYIPLICLSLYYLYMTGERAALLALGFSILTALIISHRYKSILSLLLISISTSWLYSHQNIQSQYDDNVRFDIWEHGLLLAQKDLFLGRGEHHELNQDELNLYKTYATGAGKAYLQGVTPKQVTPSYNTLYHNQFIQYLVEYGLLGSLIFLIFLISPIVKAWKMHQLNHQHIALSMIFGAFLVHCIFETAFDAHSAITLGLIAGLMRIFIMPDTPKQLCFPTPKVA